MAELTAVVADTAEEIAEQATHVAEVSRALSAREIRLVVVSAGVGIVGGCAVGYFFAKRKFQTKYEALAENEILEVKNFYKERAEQEISKARRHYEAKSMAEKPELDNVMRHLGYKENNLNTTHEPIEDIKVIEEPILNLEKNVFDENRKLEAIDTWDYAVEVKSRDPEVPYVIHKDEMSQNEKEYEQSSLTYYEDDDVLADERDEPITDQDEIVGVHNLGKFGHGSNDPNIVYVRNDRLGVDYEIARSKGSFAEEVHGFIKHMDVRVRKSRRDWDG